MARTAEFDNVLNRNGLILLIISLLFCSLCTCLNLAYPGLETPALAVLVLAGSFLVSMTAMAGFKIFKML